MAQKPLQIRRLPVPRRSRGRQIVQAPAQYAGVPVPFLGAEDDPQVPGVVGAACKPQGIRLPGQTLLVLKAGEEFRRPVKVPEVVEVFRRKVSGPPGERPPQVFPRLRQGTDIDPRALAIPLQEPEQRRVNDQPLPFHRGGPYRGARGGLEEDVLPTGDGHGPPGILQRP